MHTKRNGNGSNPRNGEAGSLATAGQDKHRPPPSEVMVTAVQPTTAEALPAKEKIVVGHDSQGRAWECDADISPEIKAKMLELFKPKPAIPTPDVSLQQLAELARGDTGGSRAARNLLYWLVNWHGGLELRTLDAEHQAAFFDILEWWAAGPRSHAPLENVVHDLENWDLRPSHRLAPCVAQPLEAA